jgi:hypothetical protein
MLNDNAVKPLQNFVSILKTHRHDVDRVSDNQASKQLSTPSNCDAGRKTSMYWQLLQSFACTGS